MGLVLELLLWLLLWLVLGWSWGGCSWAAPGLLLGRGRELWQGEFVDSGCMDSESGSCLGSSVAALGLALSCFGAGPGAGPGLCWGWPWATPGAAPGLPLGRSLWSIV